MKIAGKKIEGVSRKTVIIKRETGDIKFILEAVLDDSDFEKMCPRPEPDVKLLPGGARVPDLESQAYKDNLEEWAQTKTHWLFLKSISATPDLEWETVDFSNPKTWKNYTDELLASGFSPQEQFKLLKGYMYVSGLDSEKVDDAVESFLADPQETQKS